jgi:PAS domain S-box-containing protein
MQTEIRNSGIDVIGDVPWGTHFCQFYQTRQDLIDTLVPYFKSGLESNEFCMWVTADNLTREEAVNAMLNAFPDFLKYMKKGQIEILPYDEWYLKGGTFDSQRVLDGWVEKLKRALEKGYEGLRLSGNTFWLEKERWHSFTDYEEAINNIIGKYKMMALCTYCLDKCNAVEIVDVIRNHEFAIVKKEGKWELFENSRYKITKNSLAESERRFRQLYNSMNEGLAQHDMVYDESGKAIDYIITSVNFSFEKITGLTAADTIGKKASLIYGTDIPPYLDIYEKVVSSGEPAVFETYFAPMGKYFNISVFSPEKGKFATVFSDITQRKHSEQRLLEQATILANVGDAIIGYDTDFRVTYWNPVAEKIYGYSDVEAMGKIGSVLLKPTYSNITRDELINRIQLEGHIETTSSRITKGGRVIEIESHIIASRDRQGNVSGYVAIDREITERKKLEEVLRQNAKSQRTLNETSSLLLTSQQPEKIIKDIACKVMENINCDIFFNFIIDEDKGRLRLNAFSGITEEAVRSIEWLDFGEAICGCVARDGGRIVSENIQENGDPRAALVRSFGIKAYASFPLCIEGKTIGTLSFGTRLHTSFSSYDLNIIESVAGQVSVAIQRKQAQDNLLREKAFSETAINSLPGIFYLFKENGKFLRWNRNFEIVTGYCAAEFSNLRPLDLFDSRDKKSVADAIQKVFAEGKANVEANLILKSGRKVLYYFTGIRMIENGVPYLIGSGIDISEREQAEELLHKTSDYLNNLLDYANAPIIVWDPQFRITLFNHAFERLTGISAGEIIGKQLDILFPNNSKTDSMKKIELTISGKRWEAVEIPILCRDGSMRIVLWNSATLLDADGNKMVATIAQGQDITDRIKVEEEVKKLNEELKRRANELEVSNKELEAFSYSVSHDLRAPLRSMEGFSQALLEDFSDILNEEGKDYLKRIQGSAVLMADLIDDLLQLSRLSRSDMRFDPVNLSEMAHTIANDLKKTQPERNVEFVIQPQLITQGDEKLLHIMLYNLLENAWKFTGKSSTAKIQFGAVERDQKRVYFVRDNGVGFDMAYVGKMFHPFQRLHSISDFSGTGIGLASVQRVISRHGGQVWAEGKEGKGATLYFTLP